MSQFGTVAVQAIILLQGNQLLSPKQAWNQVLATANLSPSTKSKCCPRVAFTGLCNCGCIVGIPATIIPPPIKANARYAYEAYHILSAQNIPVALRSQVAPSQMNLWGQVLTALGIGSLSHNSQMAVVLEPWIQGLI